MKRIFFIGMAIITIAVSNFLLTSCSDKASQPAIRTLSSVKLLSDESLGTPYHICVTDKYLILGNMKSDTILEVYTLNERKKINQFLLHGEGPGEMLLLSSIQYSKAGRCFYLSDVLKNLIYEVSESDIEKAHPNIKEIFRFQPEKLPKNAMIGGWQKFLSNGKMLASGAAPEGMLAYFNQQMTEFSYYEPYPDKEKVNSELTDRANIQLYASCSAVSPDAEKLAVACYGADVIGFARLDGNGLKTKFVKAQYPNDIYVEHFDSENVQAAFTKESLRHYAWVTASDKKVYALYSGKKERDCARGLMRGNEVRCYDWDGNLLEKMKLDCEVLQIAISPDNQYLFAVSESPETGYSILKYEL